MLKNFNYSISVLQKESDVVLLLLKNVTKMRLLSILNNNKTSQRNNSLKGWRKNIHVKYDNTCGD